MGKNTKETNEIEFKPCPFCGGTNLEFFIYDPKPDPEKLYGNFDSIHCNDCDISVQFHTYVFTEKNRLNVKKRVIANKWNKRKYEEEHNDRVKNK